MSVTGTLTVGDKILFAVDSFPNFAAPVGSVALSAGSMYVKIGSDDHEWNSVASMPNTALFGGGYAGTYSNVIDRVDIVQINNAVDFGDLTEARSYVATCSSTTRGITAGSPMAIN